MHESLVYFFILWYNIGFCIFKKRLQFLPIFAHHVPLVCGPVRSNEGEELAGVVLGTKLLTVLGIWSVDLCHIGSRKVHILQKRLSALLKVTDLNKCQSTRM